MVVLVDCRSAARKQTGVNVKQESSPNARRDGEPGQGDSMGLRDLDANQRDQYARRRDENADERDENADERDENADERDVDGEQRDVDGEQRDFSADQRDLQGLRRDVDANRRDQRERDSEQRYLAGTSNRTGIDAEARRVSSLRREHAASDRRSAMRDRDDAAAERGQARLDRGRALANRVAGASGRQSAGQDRGTASDDRAASATDRRFGQEERFHELANNVDAGFTLRLVEPSEYLYLNPAYYKIFGLDPGGPMPIPADSIAMVHPEDRARVTTILDGAAQGEPVEQEWRIVGRDGAQRWISGWACGITDDDGVIRRVTGIFTDITDRKTADAALRSSEERLEQLARSTEVGFFVREQNRMLYMNAGLFRILALDPEMPNPTMPDILSMIHPLDRELSAAVTAGADRNNSTQVELRIIRPDGEIRWIRQTNDPVATTGDGPIRVAGTITDITERKNAEATARGAQLDAERANAAKDEFLSRMSHELRTPLNAVLGFAQLLEMDGLTPSQDEAVGHILRGGKHLLAMINDVLDIAGIESDRLELSPETVHIAELISESTGLMRPLAATRGIEIDIESGPQTANCFVRADLRRLKQVLLNLLSNAIKYNRRDGRIVVSVLLAGETHLRIAVTDTGMGIQPEHMPRLFSPFDRLGQLATDVEGTGLGLALSQRLTNLMGGRIDAESSPGNGSTFTVTMPLTDAPEPPPPPHTPTSRPHASTRLSTVLYIEDNPSNVDLLAGILCRRPGWSLTHAGTGGLGLELAGTTEPTVILLDLHLPDITGLDVIRALQANPDTASIPVAVLSADATSTQVGRLLAAGAVEYFTKPIDVTEMFAFLDSHAR